MIPNFLGKDIRPSLSGPEPGSEFQFPVDNVIVAIGQGPNPVLLRNTAGLVLNKHDYIQADPEIFATSSPGVYAGGDIVTGAVTVIPPWAPVKKQPVK
jgi:NADPH-dependent glutamate synthase beta chain and related oxidoreductases